VRHFDIVPGCDDELMDYFAADFCRRFVKGSLFFFFLFRGELSCSEIRGDAA
jgi:hypothetical protein